MTAVRLVAAGGYQSVNRVSSATAGGGSRSRILSSLGYTQDDGQAISSNVGQSVRFKSEKSSRDNF